ncbi:MAG: ABC transporter substrate-binding protein [Verrucomicrobiota bacterium]
MILINDYSNGNDMVVARPGIASIKDLKGKTIGVEIGFVGHLLLLKALEKNGMTEKDVKLVNVATDETPQTLASGDVDAIVAWQPNSGKALEAVAGSKAIFSSADVPGLIYDVLAVAPKSYVTRKKDWAKVLKAWYMAVDYIKDPATTDDAVRIMSSRVEISPESYKPFLAGTYILKKEEALARGAKGEGFDSLYGSSKISDDFNVRYKVYDEPQKMKSYIDLSLMKKL